MPVHADEARLFEGVQDSPHHLPNGAKLGGHLAVRLGQPAVLGELVVGVLLGNLDAVGLGWLKAIETDTTIWGSDGLASRMDRVIPTIRPASQALVGIWT